MATIGERIRRMREKRNLTQGELGKFAGVSVASVSKWEKNQAEPKGNNLSAIAQALGVEMAWILTGEGNTSPGPDIQAGIPILGYTTAGAFKHVRELEHDEIEDYISSTFKQNGYRFALRISGQSMENPGGKQHIPDGSIVVFNAQNREPCNGQLVLAKINGADEITFKRFVRDGQNVFLEPLNPRYPIITAPFRVLAVAEEMVQRL